MKHSKVLTTCIALLLVGTIAIGCPAKDNTTPPPPYIPPKPAEYTVSGLSLPSEAVMAGSPLSVSIKVANVGDLPGTYSAALKVEKDEVAVTLPGREVVLAAGESKTVSFSITIDAAGTFEVSIGEVSGVVEILPLSLSGAVLTSEDLPSGFGVIGLEELGMTLEELGASYGELGGDTIDFFGFVSGRTPATFAMLYGLNLYPLTALEQTIVSLGLDDTDTFMVEFVAFAASGTTVESYEILPALSDIGDKSVGVRVYIESEGVTMVIDTVIFINSEVASVLILTWFEGYTSPVSSEELAHIIADKVTAALVSAADSFNVTLLD
jgi:hypothetical protein